jgi:hypothetical protein
MYYNKKKLGKYTQDGGSATLQSTQHIINASYNHRLFTLLELITKYEANTCVALLNACRRLVRALFLL